MSENYSLVEVNILRINPKSIIVEAPDGNEVVIGRSCIYGPDEIQLDRLATPQKAEIKIFEWLAKKESLL